MKLVQTTSLLKASHAEAQALPFVSVGLPVYNGEGSLASTLESLLGQDYPNYEIVVCDNCSTDGTAEIAGRMAARYPQVRFFRNEKNIGSFRNFERVLTHARGKYFMWAGHHDSWSKGLVSKAVEMMEENPRTVLCFAPWTAVDEKNEHHHIRSPLIDTRGRSPAERVMLFLLGVDWCYQVYGVHRSNALRRAMPFTRQIFCPDLLVMASLACLGEFAPMHDQMFYMSVRSHDLKEYDLLAHFTRHELYLGKRTVMFSLPVIILLLIVRMLRHYPRPLELPFLIPQIIFSVSERFSGLRRMLEKALVRKNGSSIYPDIE